MLVRMGALISQASGTVGGVTFAAGKGGQVVKSRAVRVDRSSSEQLAARARQAYLASYFRANYSTIRKQLAGLVNLTSSRNRLGTEKPMSPYAMFLLWAANWYRTQGSMVPGTILPKISPAPRAVTFSYSSSGAATLGVTFWWLGAAEYYVWLRVVRSMKTVTPAHWRGWRASTWAGYVAASGSLSVNIKSYFEAALGAPGVGEAVAVRVSVKAVDGTGSIIGASAGYYLDSFEVEKSAIVAA